LDQAQQEAEEAAERSRSRKRTAIIAGVLVPVLVLLIIGGGIAYYLWRRKRGQLREINMGPLDTTPKPFIDEGQVLSINSFLDTHSDASPRSPKTPPGAPPGLGHGGQNSLSLTGSEPFDPYSMTDSTATSSTRPNSGSSTGRPGFTSFPSTSVRRPGGKAAEAGMNRSPNSDLLSTSGTQTNGSSSSAPGSTTQLAPSTIIQSSDNQGEYIIQHRDGGGVVRELPPPYADRISRQAST